MPSIAAASKLTPLPDAGRAEYFCNLSRPARMRLDIDQAALGPALHILHSELPYGTPESDLKLRHPLP
jgi:hypothetical protein